MYRCSETLPPVWMDGRVSLFCGGWQLLFGREMIMKIKRQKILNQQWISLKG